MANNSLTLDISARATGQESIDSLSAALNRFSANAERVGSTGPVIAAQARSVEVAFEHSVPQIAAASAAVRAFEGTLSVRAVERFLTTTLQLGPVLQKIFPVVGALAFADVLIKGGEELYKFWQKWDPVHQAQERSVELAKELGSEITKIGEALGKLQFAALEGAIGKVAAGAVQASGMSGNITANRNISAGLGQDISRLRQTIKDDTHSLSQADLMAVRVQHPSDFTTLPPSALTYEGKQAKAARIEIGNLQKQKGLIDAGIEKALAEQSAAFTSVNEAQLKLNEDAAKTAADQAKQVSERLAEQRKRAQSVSDSEIERTLTGPARVLYAANARTATFDDTQSRAKVAAAGLFEFQSSARDAYAKGESLIQKENAQQLSENEKRFIETLRQRIRSGEEAVAADRQIISMQDALTREGGAMAVRGVEGRGNFSGSMVGLNSRLTDAEKIAAMSQVELATAQRRRDVEIETAAGLLDEKAKAVAFQQAGLDYEEQLQRLKETNIERITELQNRQLEDFRAGVGSAFDSLLNHSFGNFLKSQALGIGKTMVENLAAEALPAITKMIPHAASGSRMADILKGTPFGADPLKTATDANTAATIANTAALTGKGLAMSASGGGGGALSGVDPNSPFVFHGFGSGRDSAGVDLSATSGTSMIPKSSGMSTMGKVAGGAAAVGGAFAAFSDFRSGGAKNDIAGVGAGLGTAAGIAAMIPGGQVVALGLGIAAAATSLISAVMPDPKTVREAAINKELQQNKYIAPTALNVTQGTNGTYQDFDARGNLRGSNFSAMPQVNEPYLHWHGGYDGTQGFYQVPGAVTSPYSPGQPGPTTIINITATDSQSFHEALQRNANSVGEAVATHLQNVDGRLKAAVQYVAG